MEKIVDTERKDGDELLVAAIKAYQAEGLPQEYINSLTIASRSISWHKYQTHPDMDAQYKGISDG